MIDPRALQQHFKKINQKQEPKAIPIPRIPDPKPLTAIEAIFVPKPIIEQKEDVNPVPEINSKIEESKEKINLIIDVPPPIGDLVIEETELEELETTNNDDYDPYGYYSSPRF
jgi:hypothetical protein